MISKSQFSTLKSILPESGWFLAGGALLPGHYSDLDIYFYTEEDYKRALGTVKIPPSYSTSNADTFYAFNSMYNTVQFVTKSFGTPEQVLTDFDLNKSRQAILPDGTLYQHSTFHDNLYFEPCNFRNNTLTRFVKYVTDKKQTPDITRLQSSIANILEMPLDTIHRPYYLEGKEINTENLSNWTTTNLISKFLASHGLAFGWLLPVFESLPTDKRLVLYLDIIHKYTTFIPIDSMSLELQAVLYLHITNSSTNYNFDGHTCKFTTPDYIYQAYSELFL